MNGTAAPLGPNRARGAGLLTWIVFGTVIAAGAFAAYQILPFYYYYYELRNHFEQVIKVASLETDAEIRKKLMYHIKKYQIPCEPEDLKIERSDDTMTVSLAYDEVFYIRFNGKEYTLHTFHFDATVTKKYK
jgi:hypothetical protein